MLCPSPAVRTDIGTGCSDGVRNIRHPFECERTGKYREGQFSLLEQTQKSPEFDTAPELEHTFASEVSAFERRSPISFRQLGFSESLAILDGSFGAFLDIDDEVEGDSGSVRPFRIGRMCAVSTKSRSYSEELIK